MKSAYELAMEKLGGIKKIPEEIKKQIAEIESKYKAKIAEAELNADNKIKSCADPFQIDQIKAQLAAEIAKLKEKCESEKEKIRSGCE